jgi:hypothetical protein
LALEFHVRPQVFPPQQPAVQLPPAQHQPEVFHLRQRLRLLLQGHRRRESRQLAERRRVRVAQRPGLTPQRRHANERVLLRALGLEKSPAGKADRRKQNPRAVEPEKSAAREPDRRKPDLRPVVLNFSENHLRQPGNLRPKQQVPAKEPEKAHNRVLIGSRKGPRARLPHRDLRSRNNPRLHSTLIGR